ncbi:hypothetical protein EK21DRAFT_118438 [Setomelanomma holmii]|uniref:Nephrocystin 3-like N-terminal domain-containing protein n=1 Tax=Setomelanomma holmii TaxID=210430 RepID=A0A9P4GYD9_9PLEO|nr:hypothetical protein EK21DRAFT_118438 [Setomelanomma holmii]
MQHLPQVYVMHDALDECIQRPELMEMLEIITGWEPLNVHVIVTSRRERDIESSTWTYGEETPPSLYFAALFGIEDVVKVRLVKSADVNAQVGAYGNALEACSSQGHDAVVKLLLNEGAGVNAQGGKYGNSFQAAPFGGHEIEIAAGQGRRL